MYFVRLICYLCAEVVKPMKFNVTCLLLVIVICDFPIYYDDLSHSIRVSSPYFHVFLLLCLDTIKNAKIKYSFDFLFPVMKTKKFFFLVCNIKKSDMTSKNEVMTS